MKESLTEVGAWLWQYTRLITIREHGKPSFLVPAQVRRASEVVVVDPDISGISVSEFGDYVTCVVVVVVVLEKIVSIFFET